MRFLIVGPGAMGCLFAAHLKRSGTDVALMDHNSERAYFLNSNGIKLTEKDKDNVFNIKIPVVTGRPEFNPDVILVCVKANQTKAVSRTIKNWITTDTAVLTLQNGLGNMEVLESVFKTNIVLGGITSEGATLKAPGCVFHAGRGQTVIGPKVRDRLLVKDIVSVFNDAGFDTTASDNIVDLMWGKLVVNAAINPLTAITGLKNGALLDHEGTKILMERVIFEVTKIVTAKGIDLPYSDPVGHVQEVCRATGNNISSMLQDVLKRRLTEIDYINGAIVKEADALDIDTPVNRALTLFVKIIEKGYLKNDLS